MSLLDKRSYYKPFKYDWAFEAYEMQNKMHWTPALVPLGDDVKDWNLKLTEAEKNLLTQIFRFFTQADLDIAAGYLDKFIPIFQAPEVRMMLSTFAAMEAIHIHAYSLLLDTVGMPEVEYQAFSKYQSMAAKHDYLAKVDPVLVRELLADEYALSPIKPQDFYMEIAVALAIYSAFGEGMQLFSSFAILLNFERQGMMKGMTTIVAWSVKDESLHIESMIKLFHTFIDEHKSLWKNTLKSRIYQAARDMVELEDQFIDLAFEMGEIKDLTADEVKQYIRYIADRRLLQLGLKPAFNVSKNPLPWLDWVLNGVKHINFFEQRSSEYSKGALTGSWDDVWKEFDDVPSAVPDKQQETET